MMNEEWNVIKLVLALATIFSGKALNGQKRKVEREEFQVSTFITTLFITRASIAR